MAMAIVVIIITTTIITILNNHDHTSHRVRLCGHVLLLLLTIIITSIVIIIIISIIIIIVISTIPQASPAIVVVTVSSTQLTCHPRVLYLTSIRTALRSYKFHIVSTPNMSVGNVLRSEENFRTPSDHYTAPCPGCFGRCTVSCQPGRSGVRESTDKIGMMTVLMVMVPTVTMTSPTMMMAVVILNS